MHNQTTIKQPVYLAGVGLHKGQHNQLICKPAPANHGIVFKVIQNGTWAFIPALAQYGKRNLCCTSLAKDGVVLYTTEHFLSAVRGLGIDNLLVEVTGNEIPIFDGSSWEFITALKNVGLQSLKDYRHYLQVLKPIVVEEQDKFSALYPSHQAEFKCLIDFNHPKINRQEYHLVNLDTYTEEIAASRTFVLQKDVDYLFSNGMAKGGNLNNAIVLGNNGLVLNQGGLRYKDEFVRHKILDAIGDLFLAGSPILGCYKASKAGHWLNLQLVLKLLSSPESWTMTTQPSQKTTQVANALQHVA